MRDHELFGGLPSGFRWRGWGAVVVLVRLSGCRGGGESAAPPVVPKAALTISTAPVEQRSWSHPIEASGAVVAWQEAIVSSRVAGLPLIELSAEVGDTVQRGQRLARFDDRLVRTEQAQAEATLAQARATAAQAKANLSRARTLQGQKAVSEQELLQAVTQADTTAAQLALAQATLEAVAVRLENTQVLAPDAGVISARSATLGQVAASGLELFRLTRQNRLEWRAELTAPQLAAVEVGMGAELTLADGSRAEGRLRLIAPNLDPISRLGWAYVALLPGSAARVGMYVSGRIDRPATAATVVPGESVVIRDGHTLLFRLEGDRVERVAVTLGRRQGEWVEVVKGVTVGDIVAVRGAGFLNSGDRVRVAPAPPPASTVTAE